MPARLSLDQKPSRASYPGWLRQKFRIDAVARGRGYYETVASSLRDQISESPFWKSVLSSMPDFEAEYRLATGFDLWVGGPPRLLIKGWDRFLDKTFRVNVQNNDDWPDAPSGEWLVPPYWFTGVPDVIRTMFVVKYMDGVHHLGSKLEQSARDSGLKYAARLQNTELGYYAGHIRVAMHLQVPVRSFVSESHLIWVEIQVTTQVQELIRALLHPHYEAHQGSNRLDESWKWDYGGMEFASNYLGHILHYLEGQIMNVRERNDGG